KSVKNQINSCCHMGYPPMIGNEHFHRGYSLMPQKSKSLISYGIIRKNGVVGPPAHGRYVYFDQAQSVTAACAILNSSLFYVYFIAYGDCFHLSDTLVSGFPISGSLLADQRLVELGESLQTSLLANAEHKTIRTRDGSEIAYAEFFAAKSK